MSQGGRCSHIQRGLSEPTAAAAAPQLCWAAHEQPPLPAHPNKCLRPHNQTAYALFLSFTQHVRRAHGSTQAPLHPGRAQKRTWPLATSCTCCPAVTPRGQQYILIILLVVASPSAFVVPWEGKTSTLAEKNHRGSGGNQRPRPVRRNTYRRRPQKRERSAAAWRQKITQQKTTERERETGGAEAVITNSSCVIAVVPDGDNREWEPIVIYRQADRQTCQQRPSRVS